MMLVQHVKKTALLSLPEERGLYEKIKEITPQPTHQTKKYAAYFVELTELKPFIDEFFDNVMIMTDDEKVKNNRIALLWMLKERFNQVADISVLQPKTAE